MANISHLVADHILPPDPPEIQLIRAIRDSGQHPPTSVVFDGQIHRYGATAGDDALWYVAFDNNIPGGAFGSWREGTSSNWRADTGRTYSMVEEMAFKTAMEEARRKAETAKRIKQELAANDCAEIWGGLSPASPDHPYLSRKRVGAHMARVNGRGDLVIPMVDESGAIVSLQTIDANGGKLFHKGGKVKGAFVSFGESGPIAYVAEGFATAATIYEETGKWTLAAFSASNLPEVVGTLRGSNQGLEIVVVADLDKNGTGQFYADQAAAKYGARVIVSPTSSDVNDFRASGGDLLSLLSPSPESWLIDGDTFTEAPAPIRWLIKKWLQCDSLMMVHGPSGSGKTFVVLDWCLRLASDVPEWRGFKVRPCPVVYLAGEGHHGIKGRMAAWKTHHKSVASLKNISISRSGCDLNTPQGLQLVLSQIRQLPTLPGLVVVDTLHRFLSGDENSAQDAKTMLDACAVIQREFSCSVLLVHHTGVNEEAQHRARGSSAWRGALDIEISIQPGAPLSIIQKKSKDAELAEKIFAEIRPVAVPGWVDEDGEPVISAVLTEGDAPQKRASKSEELALKSIEKAWQESGEELLDGLPYVTRSAWKRSMVDSGVAESLASQSVKPGASGKFASRLIEAEMVEVFDAGYKILVPMISSKLGT